MAAPLAVPRVVEELRSVLVADSTLSAMLAVFATGFGTGPGIYSEGGVPPKAGFPYLTIGATTEVPFNTMGDNGLSGGSECTIQVKAFSAKMRDDEANAIMDRVHADLDAIDLSIYDYQSACCQFDSSPGIFVEDVGGRLIRQYPVIYRVYVHQSA